MPVVQASKEGNPFGFRESSAPEKLNRYRIYQSPYPVTPTSSRESAMPSSPVILAASKWTAVNDPGQPGFPADEEKLQVESDEESLAIILH
jgi:hypothetical protein